MRLKAFLFSCLVIIGLAWSYGDWVLDQIAGCNDDVRGRFERSASANLYESYYRKDVRASDFKWVIERTAGGCLVSARAYGTDPLSGWKRITYEGDTFFINFAEGMIYPQSSGARLIVEGGRERLP